MSKNLDNTEFLNIDIKSFVFNSTTLETKMTLEMDEYFLNELKQGKDVRELIAFQYFKAKKLDVNLPKPDYARSQVKDIQIGENNLQGYRTYSLFFELDDKGYSIANKHGFIYFLVSDYLRACGINMSIKEFLFENFPEFEI